jgi:serine/threonine protein kinase
VIVQLFDGKKILVFPHSRADSDMWVDLLQRAATRKIGNYYGVTGLIGMGSFAEVRIGYDKASGDQVAIKVMKKNKRDTELMRSVECEMNFISKNIDHENIVKTYDVFDTRDNLFIVMEYMPGGMLYDILATEGQFSEKHAACIMRDLLEAVHCLHSYDIVHRDIKPENVLAVNKALPLQVKLADFGLADFVLENSFGEKSTCGMYGTPFFVAPEVIRAETYTPAVDIWSLGVLAYNMLSGKLPFDGSNIKEVLRRVRSGRYTFPDSEWAQISEEAKSFIAGLLELDPHNRLTAGQALRHPWLNNENLSESAIQNDRSALGYDQRKLRMSSMAIDDVAALLDMDDDEGEDSVNGGASQHQLKALVKLFPARNSSAKAPSSSRASSGASPSPSNSLGHSSTPDGRPPRPPSRSQASGSGSASPRFKNRAKIGNHQAEKSSRRSSGTKARFEEPQLRSSDDLLPPLHPLQASGSIPMSSDSMSPEDIDAFTNPYSYRRNTIAVGNEGSGNGSAADGPNARRNDSNGQSSFGQEHDSSGYDQQHIGGLESNPGFALPAIVSVKEIRRQKEAAAAAAAAAAKAGGSSVGTGSAPLAVGTGSNGHGLGRPILVEDDSDDDDDEDVYGTSMFSMAPGRVK